jgi:succinate dehydrogenase / fumarate reductase iron-sulfur subunit
MIACMDVAGFGACSNEGECEAVCPKEIKLDNIARLRRELVRAMFAEKI